MKTLTLLLIIIFSHQVLANKKDEEVYFFSSECVFWVEIQKSPSYEYWDIFVKVNDTEAKKLYLFSERNLKKGVVLKDGNGVILSEPRILQTFSSAFSLSADDEQQALSIKQRLLNTQGECGERNTAN